MLEAFWKTPPFGTDAAIRNAIQKDAFAALTQRHADRCPGYQHILDLRYGGVPAMEHVEHIPYLPVPLFKIMDMASVPRDRIIRTMVSSGTSGRPVSRIHLDAETATNQARALALICREILGDRRLPLVIVDQERVVRDRAAFNARTAAILGLSPLGRRPFYLLDDEMNPDWNGLAAYLKKHEGERPLIFGFTFMVWQHLLLAAEADGVELDLSDGILLHGGGWKRLTDQHVDNAAFRRRLRKRFGLDAVHNYYGMVEQAGSIFLECREGHLHASAFSDILVRDPETLNPSVAGQEGILQVLSVLPTSYPGHSLLTEDRGTWLGIDTCPCGWAGRYFLVHGRLPEAELRGCSDVTRFV